MIICLIWITSGTYKKLSWGGQSIITFYSAFFQALFTSIANQPFVYNIYSYNLIFLTQYELSDSALTFFAFLLFNLQPRELQSYPINLVKTFVSRLTIKLVLELAQLGRALFYTFLVFHLQLRKLQPYLTILVGTFIGQLIIELILGIKIAKRRYGHLGQWKRVLNSKLGLLRPTKLVFISKNYGQ